MGSRQARKEGTPAREIDPRASPFNGVKQTQASSPPMVPNKRYYFGRGHCEFGSQAFRQGCTPRAVVSGQAHRASAREVPILPFRPKRFFSCRPSASRYQKGALWGGWGSKHKGKRLSGRPRFFKRYKAFLGGQYLYISIFILREETR